MSILGPFVNFSSVFRKFLAMGIFSGSEYKGKRLNLERLVLRGIMVTDLHLRGFIFPKTLKSWQTELRGFIPFRLLFLNLEEIIKKFRKRYTQFFCNRI